MSPRHVAIVGCGFTGTSAFFQLVDRHPVTAITIFEASGRFGPGYPYQPDEAPDYLINNTVDTLCLTPGNRGAFLAWLRTRPDLAPDPDPKSHLPRALYGQFLTDVVRATRTVAAIKGIDVRLIGEPVVDMAESGAGIVTLSHPSGTVQADMVILATGRCPDRGGFPALEAGGGARYFASHIPGTGLDAIPLDATVHVLGASLSAYDVVNRLFAPATGCRFIPDGADRLRFEPGPNHRHVVLCGRSGRLKKVESRFPSPITRRHFTTERLQALSAAGGTDLETILGLIRADLDDHGAAIDWERLRAPYAGCADPAEVTARAAEILADDLTAATAPPGARANLLVDLLGNAQRTFWDGFAAGALTPAEERRYRDRYETALLTLIAPCPPLTAARLLALIRAGRLTIRTGTRAVEPVADGIAITHAHGDEVARVVIDTTGSVDRDVTSPRQPPLVAALHHRGLLRPHVRDGIGLEGAAVDMASFRLPGTTAIYLANMLLWGPGFFTSSAFLMAGVVERLLAAAFAEPVPLQRCTIA